MNLSSRSRYGIRALIDLAVNARESCIQLGDIAVRNDISVKYLEQIFMSLRKGGMIRSIKGPQGGYLLARTPEEILLSDVIRLLDGDYLLEKEDTGNGENLASRVIQEKMIEPMNQWMSQFLEHLTLQTLLEAYEQELASSQDMYYI